jgi:hypothetical protein
MAGLQLGQIYQQKDFWSPQMKAKFTLYLLLTTVAGSLFGQNNAVSLQSRQTCPGDPPANLTSVDCNFTHGQRVTNLVTGSLTDQAILSAVVFGAFAHVRNNPKEWSRDPAGFGYRVGSRYAQGLSRGIVEFGFGELMRTDPRHVSYASDPRVQRSQKQPTTGRRIGHAFMDFLTVRRSAVDGGGRPLPNLPLFAGAAASGLVGNLWYPDSQTTASQTAWRASGSLATALGASFYTEFSPEIGRLLGAITKRGKTPASPKGTQ